MDHPLPRCYFAVAGFAAAAFAGVLFSVILDPQESSTPPAEVTPKVEAAGNGSAPAAQSVSIGQEELGKLVSR